MAKMLKITRKSKFTELIQAGLAQLLLDRGLHCIGCHAAPFESLEEGCRAHGMSEQEIDKLIRELNRCLE